MDFEKLGSFYLGRIYDPAAGAVGTELLLYDSKDLTTHAICVGMTGSGKTGLCVSLLEEAAIDGIPAIAIDPKGDLANLCLTFPELGPSDFQPWVDPGEAGRKGLTPEAYAAQVAQTWQHGLREWGQDGTRIARFRTAVDLAVYTPGSTSGRPLRLLESLAAPPPATTATADALHDRIQTAVSGLLSLVGIAADPLRSREHILISNLLDHAWREGRDLGIGALIAAIQSPPFDRLGVIDLESFFPSRGRVELVMTLNSLLASPGFRAWMEGEPLDIGRLLYTADGRPRLAILSIAHLSDRERMFFVTQLLNEVVSWMRAQPGTSSLRALLYMDEVFGYFPPTANPPSKLPMLTLLKQARAFGLGVVLATQNPIDLDYKGLSNAGTWFLGRLQTERDKARVLDGLEGAATALGAALDRAEIDRILSGLKSRVFLMHSVHDDHPVLFHTRWTLSYLRGPLTHDQIRLLAQRREEEPGPQPAPPSAARPAPMAGAQSPDAATADRPPIAPGIPQHLAACLTPRPAGSRVVYRPALLGSARLHYVDRRVNVDHWEEVHLIAPLEDTPTPDLWDRAECLAGKPQLAAHAEPDARFAALPRGATRADDYAAFGKGLAASLYRTRRLELLSAPHLKLYSTPGQSLGDFKTAVRQATREARDLELEKLRTRYAPKLSALQERIRLAEERLAREESQHQQQKLQTVVSLGATVIGALFGRRLATTGTVGRATTTMRGAGRIARERGDVARASERLEDLRVALEALEQEFENAASQLVQRLDAAAAEIVPWPIRARKSDIAVEPVALLWTPWWISPAGIAEPAV